MFLLPCVMSFHEQGFDSISVVTRLKSAISHAMAEVHRGIVVGMRCEPAHLAAERPLIRSVFAVRIMAYTTRLRRVGRDDGVAIPPRFSAFHAICRGICARLDAFKYAFMARALNRMETTDSCS